ncbi:PAS domain-containing protein [Kiloniella antarctica]|uniref:PAS domain-containing protein n=1 Tax=Kiloniella antarctica TaxID=1550907 RepID=A0ABW5BD17_9PROT
MAKTFDIVKVLEVSEFNIKSVAQNNLYRYWLELKGSNNLPKWQDFDPCAIRESLPGIMLFDVQKTGEFFVSVTGENCRETLGIPSKRSNLEDIIPSNALADVKSRLSHVLNTQKPHLVTKRMAWKTEASPEEQHQSYTVLFLPFTFEHEKVQLKILNSLYFH